jgi:outer membrane receptor protein involved in Fe transport
LTARIQSDVIVASGLDASAGFEFQRERAESTFITDGSVGIPVRRNVLAYFGEARWNRASRVFLAAGVRADDIRRNPLAANPAGFVPRPAFEAESRLSVNPKVSAAWIVHQGAGTFTKIRAAAGSGIRPADGFEIAFTNNPSLKPERSRSYEAGIDHALAGGRVLVEATAFHNEFDDLIVAVGSFLESSRYTTDNISNARAQGLEVAGTARASLGAADLQIRVAYTRLDTKILAVDRDSAAPPPFVAGAPLLRRPRDQASAEIVAAAGRVTAYLRGGARGRVLDVEPSLGTWGGLFHAAGYSVWNAGASWRFTPALEITGGVDNLFDRSYEEAFGFPALGRSAMIGVRVAARR